VAGGGNLAGQAVARFSTGGWRKQAVPEPPAAASPGAAVSSEFGERIAAAAAALERNGIRPLLAATGAGARGQAASRTAGPGRWCGSRRR
jgi:hypothetical protein